MPFKVCLTMELLAAFNKGLIHHKRFLEKQFPFDKREALGDMNKVG